MKGKLRGLLRGLSSLGFNVVSSRFLGEFFPGSLGYNEISKLVFSNIRKRNEY
jgi:hypothetical protein